MRMPLKHVALLIALCVVLFSFVSNASSAGQRRIQAEAQAIERIQIQEKAEAAAREAVALRAAAIRGIGEAVQDEEEEQAEEEDEEPTGPLNNISDNMETLISFDWDNGVLVPVLPETQQEIQQTIYAIRASSGGGGMSSSSSGAQSWRYQFQGQALSGIFQRNWPRNAIQNQLLIRLVELAEPNRELTITQQEDESLSIVLSGGQSPYILRVRQTSGGEFIAQFVDETIVHSARSENFAQFARNHVEFAQYELVPLLRSIGISVPATPQDIAVQDAVVTRLHPIAETRLSEFEALIQGLDAGTFEERESASESFKGHYDQFQDIVNRAIDNESYAPEIRTRLFAILKENVDEDAIRVRDVVSRLKLDEDEEYLIWLLGQREAPEEQNLISLRLAELTEQTFGTDIVAWNDWLGTADIIAEPLENEHPFDEQLLTSDGQLVVMKDHTRKLIRFVTVDGELQIDRTHWSAPFGGKTLSELAQEIKDEITQRGLPETFYNGFDEQRYPQLGFPHVLFENFYHELTQHPQQGTNSTFRSGSHLTPNRQYSVNGLDCSIATMPSNQGRVVARGPNANQSNVFQLRLAESNTPRRSIGVQEDEDLLFRLEFACEDADMIARLLELPDDEGWVVQDLRGVEVFASRAPTFLELLDSNREYFDDEFFPLFAEFGFEFGGEAEAMPSGEEESPQGLDAADDR